MLAVMLKMLSAKQKSENAFVIFSKIRIEDQMQQIIAGNHKN
jgi:hypothetical protein